MIYLGKIINTFGLKGEFKVSTNSDERDIRFSKNNFIYLKLNNKFTKFKIESYKNISKDVIAIKLYEFNNISEVEKFRDYKIYSKIDIEDKRIYYTSLIGYGVVNNGEVIGTVKSLMDLTVYVNLVIESLEGKEFTIPFIENKFILKVDSNSEKIIVNIDESFYK